MAAPQQKSLNRVLLDPRSQGMRIGSAIMSRITDLGSEPGVHPVSIAAMSRVCAILCQVWVNRLDHIEDGWGPGMHRVDKELRIQCPPHATHSLRLRRELLAQRDGRAELCRGTGHRAHLVRAYKPHLNWIRIVRLNMPDNYKLMGPSLVKLLRVNVDSTPLTTKATPRAGSARRLPCVQPARKGAAEFSEVPGQAKLSAP